MGNKTTVCKSCRIRRTRIAIVGATGLVGRMFATVLTERKIDAQYVLFNREGGQEIEICGRKYITLPLTETAVGDAQVDYALFSAGGEVSKQYAPIFAEQGAVVIDNSSAWRKDESLPLVIPECNIKTVHDYLRDKKGGIIANPNCTTIGSLPALKPLDDEFVLKRVVYSSYQAISGAGANPKFAYQIENNVIPFISGEEEKMEHETNKILRGANGNIDVVATCIRVPVKNCHTVSIVADEDKKYKLPMPIFANGRDDVLVGRIRVFGNTVAMVTTSDNIRKGAATNAVQILEYLLETN